MWPGCPAAPFVQLQSVAAGREGVDAGTRAAPPAALTLPGARCLVQGRLVRSLFNQPPLNKGLLNSVERGGRRGTDVCEDGRGPRASASETQEAPAEARPPGESVIFPPNSSQPHGRLFTRAQSLHQHSGGRDMRLNRVFSSPSISKAQ